MPLFHSPKHAGYRLLIRPQYDKRHPTTGDIIETQQALWADFGHGGSVSTLMNPETGEMMETAQIIGHYYDTDQEAIANNWDQDTHDLVIRRLRDAANREPYRLQEIVREKQPAPAPWPTYDDCDAKTAVELAKTLGLAAQALAYERENRARPAVLDGLDGPDTPPETVEEPEGVGDEAVLQKAAEMVGGKKSAGSVITV